MAGSKSLECPRPISPNAVDTMCRKCSDEAGSCERFQPHGRNGRQLGGEREKTVSPVVGSALAPGQGQNGQPSLHSTQDQPPVIQAKRWRLRSAVLVDELQPGSDKPHQSEETFSSESDRLPLRKTEGRSAWGGAVIGSECEVPPQSLAVGLCPIAGQERSSASSDPQGSASAPRGQPQGTTGRGEQPEGSPRAEAEEAD